MNKRKTIGWLTSIFAIILTLTGCSSDESVDALDVSPYKLIAQVVDFTSEPEEIMTHYTEEGLNMLRMSFPDKLMRDYAVTLIGKETPNVTMTTMSNKKIELQNQEKPTVLNVTKTGNPITEEMAAYIDEFEKKHSEITVISVYPHDSEKDVKDFYNKQGVNLDPDKVVVGNSESIVKAFGTEYVPSIFYLDKTNTISYVSVGFRDLVFLEDYAEIAFGDSRFYDYINVPVETDAIDDELK